MLVINLVAQSNKSEWHFFNLLENKWKQKINSQIFYYRDSSQLTMAEVKRVLLIGLNISIKGRIQSAEMQERMRPLLHLTFHLLDKLRRFKLSKEVCIFFF